MECISIIFQLEKRNSTIHTKEAIAMAKNIKFNITVDGTSVRTIEELADHFNISDIAELYESGTLLRWLQAREYLDYAEKIQQIDTEAPLEQKVTALCSAFGFSSGDIEQAVSALLHTKRRDAALKEYAQDAASVDKIITNYLADYEKLKADLKVHSSDESFIKSAVEQLASVYRPMLQHDFKQFYMELRDSTEDYSLIIKYLRLHKTARAYLYPSASSIDFYELIETIKDHSDNLAELKESADKIAQDYMSEFTIYWNPLFNEIKDKYPLVFYALCMNQKLHDFIFQNIHDWNKYNNFLHPSDNIRRQYSQYFKRITNTRGYGQFISVSKSPVLVLLSKNADIREIPGGNASSHRIDKFVQGNSYFSSLAGFRSNFLNSYVSSLPSKLLTPDWINYDGNRASLVLFNSLEYTFHSGGGEILYMEVPETDTTAQA